MSDDGDWHLSIGCGMLSEVASHIMSPELAEAHRREAEREQREADERLEAERQEAADLQVFWAARRGEEPPRYNVGDVLKRLDEASAREDRREARRERELEAMDDFGEPLHPQGESPRPPRRLPSIVNRELAAKEQAFMDSPATVADVAHASAVSEKKFDALASFFRRLGR